MCTAREFKRGDKSRWGKCEQQNCQMSYQPKRHACAVLTDRLQLEEFKYRGELVRKQNQKLAKGGNRGPPLTQSSNKGSTETLYPERVVIQYDCHKMVQICPRYQKLTRLKQDCALACLATRTDLTGFSQRLPRTFLLTRHSLQGISFHSFELTTCLFLWLTDAKPIKCSQGGWMFLINDPKDYI